MIIKESIETQYGDVETNIIHCDSCGKKVLIDGALRWLELRHLDRDVPPLHFCTLRCVEQGTHALLAIGVEEMAMSNWSRITEHVSRAAQVRPLRQATRHFVYRFKTWRGRCLIVDLSFPRGN